MLWPPPPPPTRGGGGEVSAAAATHDACDLCVCVCVQRRCWAPANDAAITAKLASSRDAHIQFIRRSFRRIYTYINYIYIYERNQNRLLVEVQHWISTRPLHTHTYARTHIRLSLYVYIEIDCVFQIVYAMYCIYIAYRYIQYIHMYYDYTMTILQTHAFILLSTYALAVAQKINLLLSMHIHKIVSMCSVRTDRIYTIYLLYPCGG